MQLQGRRLVFEPLERRRVLSGPAGCTDSAACELLGDANRDGHFDRWDIIQVLQARKYTTGEPAEWGEGDWTGDGVFDQSDLVAALDAGTYKRRAAATAVDGEQTVADHIQRTMRLLATSTQDRRNTVRILFYGQSIIGQDWWTVVADDLRNRFPHANLVIENRALGGFNSARLIKTAETDVYSFYPDLLIFHAYGSEAYSEKIIQNVRRRTTAEILILTDHVTEDGQLSEETDPDRLSSESDREAWRNYSVLPSIAQKYETGLLDVRSQWKQYLIDEDLSTSELLRDGIHLNKRGKSLMAELVKAAFRFDPSVEPQADRWVTTYDVGKDVVWTDDRLTLDFSGNRVDVILEGQDAVWAEFSIDGKRPSEFPGTYGVTRTTYYPGSIWPTLLKTSYVQSPVVEEWRLSVIDVEDDQNRFRYELHGSETGYDGQGLSYERFVSSSGRVVIDPADWNVEYASWATKIPLDVGLEIAWEVIPYFHDRVSLAAGRLNGSEAVTAAQGLPNADHRLEIRGLPSGSIRAVQVFTPPWPRD